VFSAGADVDILANMGSEQLRSLIGAFLESGPPNGAAAVPDARRGSRDLHDRRV